MLVIGIDPSSRPAKRAWAGVQDGLLVSHGRGDGPRSETDLVACYAVEGQWLGRSDVPPRDIVKLAFAAGFALGQCPAAAVRIMLPVDVWKGAIFPAFSAPKAVFCANLRQLFGAALPASATDDEADAAGIALAAYKLRDSWPKYLVK